MEECKIKNLYNLEETMAKPLLENLTYPWEALPKISEFIIKLGNKLGIGYGNANQMLSRLNNYGITKEEFIEAIKFVDKELEKEK